MEQLWLFFSLLSLVTGFGLIVALAFLRRLAPVRVPPVFSAVTAMLLMGFASFSGVYLRVISMPRSILPYRVLNAVAWGFAVYALLRYLIEDVGADGAGSRAPGKGGVGSEAGASLAGGRAASSGAKAAVRGWRVLPSVLPGILVFSAAFLAAHPPEGGVLSAGSAAALAIIVAVELLVGVLAIVVGLRALRRSRRIAARPWRAFLKGFGIALLVLIPANLLDFGVSVVLRASGQAARDGFVFAAGYGIANIILITAIVGGIRLGREPEALSVPTQMIDAFGISRREAEVVEKLLEGKTDRQIAEELYISPRTVDTHLHSVYRKCGVNSRLRLTRLVSSYGELRNSD